MVNGMEFKKVESQKQKPASGPPAQPFIRPVSKAEAEERLFYFLRSLPEGRFQATRPLLLEADAWRDLCLAPHPDLVEALRHCLDDFLVQLGPNPANWGQLDLSPAIWSIALTIHNCLTPFPIPPYQTTSQKTNPKSKIQNPKSPARTLPDALAYHALLNRPAEVLPHLPPNQAGWLQALLNCSPLSAIYHLHHHTPPALTSLAAGLLRGWQGRAVDPDPWANLEDWLDTVALLIAQPPLAVYLRRRWLALPETRPACRNLGLLLEALRRRGDQRAFILEFYEAYEYFCAETVQAPGSRPNRRWPLLSKINRLLQTGSHIDPAHETALEAALHLNRRGNEYFLKFLPLVRLIIKQGPPTDYNHLRDLPLALRPLLDLTTAGTGQRFELASIQFGREEE